MRQKSIVLVVLGGIEVFLVEKRWLLGSVLLVFLWRKREVWWLFGWREDKRRGEERKDKRKAEKGLQGEGREKRRGRRGTTGEGQRKERREERGRLSRRKKMER